MAKHQRTSLDGTQIGARFDNARNTDRKSVV